MAETKKIKVSARIEDNIEYLKEKLGIGVSFDIVLREFKIGRKKVALIFVDGFTNGHLATLILQNLLSARHEEIVPDTLEKLISSKIPYIELDSAADMDEIVDEILSGPAALFIDGEKEAIILDIREYPARQPDEPDIEKVTRGSRDGFVETLVFNISLIRRRLRDPALRAEVFRIGQRSKTDVALLYLNDIINPHILERIRNNLLKIRVDGLPMAEKSVEEFITESFWNPFPEVRYTERPDVAAVHLLEGHAVIIVDTSPSVMIAPVTYFHHVQHAEEFRQNPIVGVYIRWVRLLGILVSFLLVPLWLLIAQEPELLPPELGFIGPQEEPNIPLLIQFIIANLGVELLRMASIHTPSPLATALGLVGGLLIGDIAVQVGLFSSETLLYMGIVAIGVFSTPSWELSLANRLVLFLLLILTGILGIPGLLTGLAMVLLRLFTTRSFGVPYMWPLFPFNWKALQSILFRQPVPIRSFRPSILKTIDEDKRPK